MYKNNNRNIRTDNYIQKNVKAGCMVLYILLLTAMLCGCGKKEKKAEEIERVYLTDDNGLGNKLGVPKQVSVKLDLPELNAPKEIFVTPKSVLLPKQDSMSVVYYRKKYSTAEYRRNILENIFGDLNDVQAFDIYNPTKEAANVEIDYYRMCLDMADRTGDARASRVYQDMIDDAYKRSSDAPEGVPLGDDFSSNEYLGKIDDVWYRVTFDEDVDNECKGFLVSSYPDGALINRRPKEGVTSATVSYQLDDVIMEEAEESSDFQNMEKAKAVACDFLAKCGVTDIALLEQGHAMWDYANVFFQDMNYFSEYNGYFFVFARNINGDVPYILDYSFLEGVKEEVEAKIETFTLYVDDKGILQMDCNLFFDEPCKTEADARLLSFDDVMKTFETEIPKYFSEHKTDYSTINFNKLRLGYYLIKDESGNADYCYTPVWIFANVDSDMAEFDYMNAPEQVFMLNAVTGEYIDLYK